MFYEFSGHELLMAKPLSNIQKCATNYLMENRQGGRGRGERKKNITFPFHQISVDYLTISKPSHMSSFKCQKRFLEVLQLPGLI